MEKMLDLIRNQKVGGSQDLAFSKSARLSEAMEPKAGARLAVPVNPPIGFF
jgi:hypothetical protein